VTTPAGSHWNTVRALFEDIVELPPKARAGVLDSRCTDLEVRAAVEHLLAADADADLLTPHRVAATLKATDDPLCAAEHTTQVPGFTVRRLLGTGGMGAVYEAEQHSPRRLVALKVLRPELCTGATVRRFQVEAEILGRLQHEGIAEVFAAGVHRASAGPFHWDMPYYAMELLAGARPLTTYARQRALAVEERLHLIAQVCAAVHHAHQRGVIHRDLKPANVIVDEGGKPKVIDFGVARALHADGGETLHTKTGVLVGTPSYMAPEQLAGADDIDVRCDVWALGVMLYELLCERLPYVLPSASSATGSAGKASTDVFATAPPRPRRLRPDLPVELDWIVGKAIAVERERRYQSAAELAADLERLRRLDSVHAAPPSTIYRLRKAVRRHRTLSASLAVGAVCLLVGLFATTRALQRAFAAEAQATSAAAQARAAEATARQAADEAREQAQRGRDEKARADVARADAESHFRDAERQHKTTAALLDLIGTAARAASRGDGGASVTLDALWEQVAQQAEANQALTPLQRAAAFNYLGALRFYSGDYPAAQRYFERCLELFNAANELGSREEIATRASLSEALRLQGRLRESEAALEQAIELANKVLRPDEAAALTLQRRWSFVLLNHGRHDEAVALCRQLLATRQSAAGGHETKETAEARMDLATALLVAGKVSEGAAEAQPALDACNATFGPHSEHAANAARTLAEAWLKQDRAQDAETLMRETRATMAGVVAPSHPRLRALASTQAAALQRLGDHGGAARLLEDSLRQSQNFGGHELLAFVTRLSAAHLAAGDHDRAAAVVLPYLAAPADAPDVVQRAWAAVQIAHARAVAAQGQRARAEADLRAAITSASKRLGAEHDTIRELNAVLDSLRAQ
jgi:serine/threonine protein kinase